ncbi:hypothetical protein ETI10_03745 [Macrococcoides goetzii]|nr:hypothetical protein [Macrococcus goetzii]TDM42219.1 hypothetical protein ETI10_03745 [Macrococcus goetzii]
MRFDNIYNHEYDDVIEMYPTLKDAMTREEFNKRKQDTPIINRIHYYVFTEYNHELKLYKSAISRYDDSDNSRDNTVIETFNDMHELKAYIDALISEDIVHCDGLHRIDVTSNKDILDYNVNERRKVYTVNHDKYTLYVKRDKRQFYDTDCYRHLYG